MFYNPINQIRSCNKLQNYYRLGSLTLTSAFCTPEEELCEKIVGQKLVIAESSCKRSKEHKNQTETIQENVKLPISEQNSTVSPQKQYH